MNDARKPLRIGILGAARIAPSAIIFPAQATGHLLVAVGARDKGRATEFAKQYQIEKAYGSYQEVIDDPNVDVVYNALHNGGHPQNPKTPSLLIEYFFDGIAPNSRAAVQRAR